MRRATITLPSDIEDALEAYRRDQDVSPGLNAVAQVAFREFLSGRGYLFPFRPLHLTPDKTGSDASDTSIEHDRYLTGA